MTEWSLSVLLAGLHDDIQQKVETVRKSFGHTTTKGDASEKVWLELLQTYLPQRYRAAKTHVVDSTASATMTIPGSQGLQPMKFLQRFVSQRGRMLRRTHASLLRRLNR